MIEESITYKDLNGQTVTESFHFHWSKKEIMDMESSEEGFGDKLREVSESKDFKVLLRNFQDIILRTYGVKSEDGKSFDKSPEIRAKFEKTEAFSELYFLLATNDDKAAEFINGVMPEGFVEEMNRLVAEREAKQPKIDFMPTAFQPPIVPTSPVTLVTTPPGLPPREAIDII